MAIDQIMPYALIIGPLFGTGGSPVHAGHLDDALCGEIPVVAGTTDSACWASYRTSWHFVPDVLGLGTEQVAEMIDEAQIGFLVLLLILKIVCLACIGWGLFGGRVFTGNFVGAQQLGAATALSPVLVSLEQDVVLRFVAWHR